MNTFKNVMRQENQGYILLHPPDKNHSEEQDNVSCLVSGLMRTSIGHPDVRPEAPVASGLVPASLVETAVEDSSPRGTLASSGDGEEQEAERC